MTARAFLLRGLLAGLLAGLATFVVAFAVGEPGIDAAIEIEESGAPAPAQDTHESQQSQEDQHDHAAPVVPSGGHGLVLAASASGAIPSGVHAHGGEETGFSRTTQKTWGLATATIAVGVALGGIVSLLAAGAAGRTGRLSLVASTALVTLLGFVAYALVPFLKYPAAPPAVGSGDTIGSRTTLFFVFLAVSVAAMAAAWAAAKALAPRIGGHGAVVASAAGYVLVVSVAAALMPAVNEIGAFPADVLWQFRVGSLLSLAAMWGSLGIALTWLLGRLERQVAAAG